MHPFRVKPSFHQGTAEADQFADGIAAVDGMHHCVRHGVEDFAAPFVNKVRRRDNEDGLARAFVLHQRRNADAHQGFAGAHFAIEEYRWQAVRDQSGVAGVDAVFLRGERLPFQPGEDVVLPVVVPTVIDHRGLPVDLRHQRLAEFGKKPLQRHDVAVARFVCISDWCVDACISNGRIAHHCISNGHVGRCIRSSRICACWYRACRSGVLCIRPGRRRTLPGEDNALCAACLLGIFGQRRHRPEGQIAAQFRVHRSGCRQHFTQVDIAKLRESGAEVAETKSNVIVGVELGQ